MRVTVSFGDNVLPLEISPDIELENLRVLIELETQVTPTDQLLILNGRALSGDNRTASALGIADNDLILLTRKPASTQLQSQGPPTTNVTGTSGVSSGTIDWSSVQLPGSLNSGHAVAPQRAQPQQAPAPANSQNLEDPEVVRQMFLSNPQQLSLLKERNPKLAEALLSNNLEQFSRVLQEQRVELMERQRERIQLLTANPFDPEVQRRIAEEIRMENVNTNMATAMEHSPESFGQVFMLYINCQVNGHPVKAFVDSGAQMTIMSKACAERCNIMHLMDHRWSGTAVGVGTQRILGRVHMCQIKIEDVFFPSSFVVLEDQKMDMLLGLDMLKRHQCCIDLRKNSLCIGTTNTETSFLPESELPAFARQISEGTAQASQGSSTDEVEDQLLAKVLEESARQNR